MTAALTRLCATPGIWSFAHREGDAGMFNTEVFCADGHTIATMAWYPMPTVDGVTGTYREGNARLCAAAPDLLLALHNMLEDGDKTDRQQALAAIEKATGVTP